MNGLCSQVLGGHERSHGDDFEWLVLDTGPKTRMEEVLGRRSISIVEEPTQI